MITRALAYLSILIALASVPACWAANPQRGLLLYENFCHHCHISEIHYRVNSRVDSWGELVRVVDMWQADMKLGWSANDVQDVASWLDRAFYHLPDAPGLR
jgi:hypothetical protein